MAEKLWGGRFGKSPSEDMFEFLSKEDAMLDEKLALYDIKGSLVHVVMLAKQGILTKEEGKEIMSALKKLKQKAEEGKFKLDIKLEDVHTNVEAEVTKLTPHGKKMHTGRSRNDQVSLDMRLYMRDAINVISASIMKLQEAFAVLAKEDCIFPSYTHFQVAQPISLNFWCHAHWHALERDLSRLSDLYVRINENPLGAGAVAGTTWIIDREYTSKLLGFDSPTENPMDTVSSRGEIEAEVISTFYFAMLHASRIAEDVILLANKRIFILPEEYSTGSSMMPQKKNPDIFEVTRGKAGRVLGLMVFSASLVKSLPSGFNRDTQESKYALDSAVENTVATLLMLSKAIPKLKVDEEKAIEELEAGYACTTELADLLAKNGVPFRKAHEITGKIVKDCISKKKYLSSLSADEVSKLAGVEIPADALKEAVSVDKVQRFSKYRILAESKHSGELEERKKKLEDADGLLEKEIAKSEK